ncbi:MAG: DUF2950 domain-containing protein [Syntrophobacteraceae bacterium]
MLSSIRGNGKEYSCRLAPLSLVVAFLLLFVFCGTGSAKVKKAVQEEFRSPEEAVSAFLQSVKDKDSKRLLAILGPGGKDLVYSGDPVADRATGDLVVRLSEQQNRVIKTGERGAALEMGVGNWRFPIPIVEKNGKWRFDTRAGREEILNRRIGRNEFGAMAVCLAYVDAQQEYASHSHDGSSLLAYAQKFISEPGKQDGLYWETKQGEPKSPVGIFMANARHEGYRKSHKPTPFHGYFFKILKAQGKNASGGAYDYVVQGRMIGGFALVAYPAKYGASGIMTFMVNHEGVVYQKDLGPGTHSIARAIKVFDPDKSWRKIE